MDDMKITKDNSEGGDNRGTARPRNFCLNRETRIVLLEMRDNKQIKFHGVGGLSSRTRLTKEEIMGAISEAGQLGLLGAVNSANGMTMFGLTQSGIRAII